MIIYRPTPKPVKPKHRCVPPYQPDENDFLEVTEPIDTIWQCDDCGKLWRVIYQPGGQKRWALVWRKHHWWKKAIKQNPQLAPLPNPFP